MRYKKYHLSSLFKEAQKHSFTFLRNFIINYPKIKELKLSDMGLNTRTFNALANADILTIKDIVNLSPRNLLVLKNFGQKSLEDLVEKIRSFVNKYKRPYWRHRI